ncbi:MAG TPA: lasso peptide biosynthesis B2 protein [Candidatus Acidoferrales bacterium]|nr:lasso peptide biosynthesis B2 protein [Candidatus Acidoferrales bacterium]
MSKWRKFRGLPAEEKKLFLRAALLLPLVRVGLKALGLKRVAALLQSSPPPPPLGNPSDRLGEARRAARLVAIAARYAGGACLAQALVSVWLLERRGIPADLRIGVRKSDRGLEAHAWVELLGTVLNDGQDVTERFAAFDRSFAPARLDWR